MELLIVYYALSSGRQNCTSCYCQLRSPHLSVFIFPFWTLESAQRGSFQHTLYAPLRQQVYRMSGDRIILCLDLLLMCTSWRKEMLIFKSIFPICTGQLLTSEKTEGVSRDQVHADAEQVSRSREEEKRRLKMVVRQY